MIGWLGIARLGLVQTALGAVVILTTSTINRLMIVELALPAILPGALVTLHYALQFLRPRWGHGADQNRRVAPWIVGGMAVLALGGFGAAISVWVLTWNTLAGVAVAALAFILIGIGVGASGTSLLTLLAKRVEPKRRAAAATIVWIMMIVGFIATAKSVSLVLDPFSPPRLIAVAGAVCAVALLITALAVWGIEKDEPAAATPAREKVAFREAFAGVWSDPAARRFAIFIFVAMLAYSAQDLILEPFAGLIYGYTPGQSTGLSSQQNTGVLAGMLLVGAMATVWSGTRGATLKAWIVIGCAASAGSLASLAAAAFLAPAWPLQASVYALGVSNGVFAVAAIGSMFTLAASGENREGVRMGIFGAAQAVAFGLGGFLGTAMADLVKLATASPAIAYASVFAAEAVLFLAAAVMALRIGAPAAATAQNPLVMAGARNAGG